MEKEDMKSSTLTSGCIRQPSSLVSSRSSSAPTTGNDSDCSLFYCGLCRNSNEHEEVQQAVSTFNQRFSTIDLLKEHMLKEHLSTMETNKVSSATAKTGKKKCDLCQRMFADSKCLKKHKQAVHSKLKPYICQVCNHQCARKAMLEMHVRQHTGEKPYKCKQCDYRTSDHNSLRRHRMRHDKKTQYACTHCDYSSIQAGQFRAHMLSKHQRVSKEVVFACTDCSFKSINARLFRAHMDRHQLGKMSEEQRVANEQEARVDSSKKTAEDKDGDGKDGSSDDSALPPKKRKFGCGKRAVMAPPSRRDEKSHEIPSSGSLVVVEEEEDSLHALPPDLGGTTIPAGQETKTLHAWYGNIIFEILYLVPKTKCPSNAFY